MFLIIFLKPLFAYMYMYVYGIHEVHDTLVVWLLLYTRSINTCGWLCCSLAISVSAVTRTAATHTLTRRWTAMLHAPRRAPVTRHNTAEDLRPTPSTTSTPPTVIILIIIIIIAGLAFSDTVV